MLTPSPGGNWTQLTISLANFDRLEGGKKGKGKREKEGGTFRVPSSILFANREEVEQYLREAMEESEGDEGDDKGRGGGTRVTTRGTGVTRGVARGRREVRRGLG